MLQGYNCVSRSVYISWKHVNLPKKYVAKSGRGWKILLLFMKALRGNLHVHISIKTCSKNVSLLEQNLNESHIIRDWVLKFILTFSIDHMHMTSQKGAQLRWGSNETLPRASSPSMQPGGQTLQATPPGWPARARALRGWVPMRTASTTRARCATLDWHRCYGDLWPFVTSLHKVYKRTFNIRQKKKNVMLPSPDRP